mmetsp:Transcript_9180/g.30619  ORF Transcript_9180/g.30619 Transcript_9180/m.30619 type:complete len:431 (-) Transcript_9180:3960-5252(-)
MDDNLSDDQFAGGIDLGNDACLSEDNDDQYNNAKIFVGGLNPSTTDEQLYSYFSRFGEVVSSKVMFSRDTGNSRRFGFAVFQSPYVAQKVCEMQTHELCGYKVETRLAVPSNRMKKATTSSETCRESSRLARQVFVGGLPTDVTPPIFREWAEQTFPGRVVNAVLVVDRLTHTKSRGFGFVTFDARDMVESAASVRMLPFADRFVEVKKAENMALKQKGSTKFDLPKSPVVRISPSGNRIETPNGRPKTLGAIQNSDGQEVDSKLNSMFQEMGLGDPQLKSKWTKPATKPGKKEQTLSGMMESQSPVPLPQDNVMEQTMEPKIPMDQQSTKPNPIGSWNMNQRSPLQHLSNDNQLHLSPTATGQPNVSNLWSMQPTHHHHQLASDNDLIFDVVKMALQGSEEDSSLASTWSSSSQGNIWGAFDQTVLHGI